jgi:hypothetical protein
MLLDRLREALRSRHYSRRTEQALSALLFLYRHVLDPQIGDLGEVIRIYRGQGPQTRDLLL